MIGTLLRRAACAARTTTAAARLAPARCFSSSPGAAASTLPPFTYQDMFEQPHKPDVPYRKLPGSEAWVSRVGGAD
jgi:hypothetical protein